MTSIQYDATLIEKIRRDIEDSLAGVTDWESRATRSRAEAREAAANAAEFRRMATQWQQLLDHAEGKSTTRPEPDPVDVRTAQIAGYRALLDFLEDNPDVPLPWHATVTHYPHLGDPTKDIAEVDRIGEALGVTAGPTYKDDPHHYARREFGAVSYAAIATNVHNQKPAEDAPSDGEATS